MSNLKSDLLILKPLSVANAQSFFALYKENFPDEDAIAFTERIIGSCDHIWSIRLLEDPDHIIGDCALHDYRKAEQSVEIGGSLLSEFQRRSIMKHAFKMIIRFARKQMQIKQIIGRTTPGNTAAIKLVQGLGFSIMSQDDIEVVLAKKVL